MKESFLVTRPRFQSEEVAGKLREEGFEVIIESISDVEYLKYDEKEVGNIKKSDVQAIFLTSFNASEAFLSFDFDKNVPIYAIGEKSAQKIKESGYKNVTFPEKSTVFDLERLFLQHNSNQTGQILYFCGNYFP